MSKQDIAIIKIINNNFQDWHNAMNKFFFFNVEVVGEKGLGDSS